MTQRMHFKTSGKIVRDSLLEVVALADDIFIKEEALVKALKNIDEQRFYVRFGYKSLMGFCNHGLKFSRTQSQRIATKVRRHEPTVNIGKKDDCLNC